MDKIINRFTGEVMCGGLTLRVVLEQHQKWLRDEEGGKRADLRGADLTRADMTGAVLTGADLTGADLIGADMTRADLTGADLIGADMTRADLTGADLTSIKSDFIAEVLKLPDELPALRLAILEGRIDGTTYSGECACLAGTLAKAKGVIGYSGGDVPVNGITFHANANSPREVFFWNINKGDTPETNQFAKIALEWTDEALAMVENIRKSA